jgi:large repetitive protein
LAAGGDIFVQQGATLTIEGGSFSGGSVASFGDAFGTGIFLQGNQTVTFGAAAEQTTPMSSPTRTAIRPR